MNHVEVLKSDKMNCNLHLPMAPSKHFIAAPEAVSSWITFTPFSRIYKEKRNVTRLNNNLT